MGTDAAAIPAITPATARRGFEAATALATCRCRHGCANQKESATLEQELPNECGGAMRKSLQSVALFHCNLPTVRGFDRAMSRGRKDANTRAVALATLLVLSSRRRRSVPVRRQKMGDAPPTNQGGTREVVAIQNPYGRKMIVQISDSNRKDKRLQACRAGLSQGI
jgi:hypothetical protein